MEEYIPVAKTISIKFTSRASVKIKDSFYTVEACEERIIPQKYVDTNDVNMEKEREDLWNTVNSECDNQIEEIIKTFK